MEPYDPGVAGVVLVHGAWHGPWCWERVIAGLEEQGIAVRATELHRGSLPADTAAVQADVDALAGDGPVVVCGHSYGGAVITGLGPSNLAHLVYLCAFMLDEQETTLEWLTEAPLTALADAMVLSEDNTYVTIDPGEARRAFYADCGDDVVTESIGRLQPQAMLPGGESPERIAWREVSATYVICELDDALHPEAQRRFAARAANTAVWPTAHSPFLSRPELVVELLAQLATAGPVPAVR
jgi:pimeloyl-ACP methyl ester carboxylesterase